MCKSCNSSRPNTKIDEVGILGSFCNDVKVLKDGDYILLYKQPSLQCMSLIAFKARMILDSYTILINHYASACPVFNADFDDGDEMNIFCVSSHASKVECVTLLAVHKCILLLMDLMPTIYTCNTWYSYKKILHDI